MKKTKTWDNEDVMTGSWALTARQTGTSTVFTMEFNFEKPENNGVIVDGEFGVLHMTAKGVSSSTTNRKPVRLFVAFTNAQRTVTITSLHIQAGYKRGKEWLLPEEHQAGSSKERLGWLESIKDVPLRWATSSYTGALD